MKTARRFETNPSAQRDTRLLLALCILSAPSAVACGSGDAGFSAGTDGGSAAQTSVAGAHAAAGSSSAVVGQGGANAQAGAGNGGASPDNGGASSGIGGSEPAAAGTGGNADACNSADACASCLCKACPAEVASCESTPGCQTIADCVKTSRCEGIACYCGSSDALTCATGNATGPCRDVILNAPGGHKPTLTNQSAGPAADAAIAVGNCASKDQACTASCQ